MFKRNCVVKYVDSFGVEHAAKVEAESLFESCDPWFAPIGFELLDGSFQTTIMVENTASQDDEVTLKLFSDWGTYNKILPIPAGGLLKINVKELEQEPDQAGNVLSGT